MQAYCSILQSYLLWRKSKILDNSSLDSLQSRLNVRTKRSTLKLIERGTDTPGTGILPEPSFFHVTHKTCIDAIMLIDIRGRFAIKKERLWGSVNEGGNNAASDLAEVHSRNELLEGLKGGIDTKTIESIIGRCRR